MIKTESRESLLALCTELADAIDELSYTRTAGDRLILAGRLRGIRSRIVAVVLNDDDQGAASS